ncbi:MAG: transketolase family protein [Anaerolineaceae bacterium]|nr:transketolase family protein [Anaerolineaceae bacterium]
MATEKTMGKPNQQVFSDTLLDLAQNDKDILVVTSDSRGSGKLVAFGETLPEQIVEVGIAEQNLVGLSSGLAAGGKKVFAVSPACFVTIRSLEQVKNDVAYSDRPVCVVGISAGVSYGLLGSTHHAIHDYAVLRCINNIDILAPADNFETEQVLRALVEHPRPAYIRLGKQAMPNLHDPATAIFEIGKAIQVRPGTDLTIISIGEPTPHAVDAADLLAKEGISCRVISMHTLRPFDRDALMDAALNTRAIITVEEHSVNGGLGELCASTLMQEGIQIPFKIVGFPDEYTINGDQETMFKHYGISGEGLAETARKLLGVRI